MLDLLKRYPCAIAAVALLLLAGCAEASPEQTVNVSPGPARPAYTAQELGQARTWLQQPRPALRKGWRYAVLLTIDTDFDGYINDRDCGSWVAMAAYSNGTLGLLCESFDSDGAALLLGPGDAVAFDDGDHDQTFTLPKELRLEGKDAVGMGR